MSSTQPEYFHYPTQFPFLLYPFLMWSTHDPELEGHVQWTALTQAVAALPSHQHAGGKRTEAPGWRKGADRGTQELSLGQPGRHGRARVCTAHAFVQIIINFGHLQLIHCNIYIFSISRSQAWFLLSFHESKLHSPWTVGMPTWVCERGGEGGAGGKDGVWWKKPFADYAFCDNQIL